MMYCKIRFGILFITAAVTLHVLSQSSDLAQLAAVLQSIKRQKNSSVQVCDALDLTENWFIYCTGDIVAAVNLHKLEEDSKTFVDRPLKHDPDEIQSAYEKEFGMTSVENIDPKKLLDFRERYFDVAGGELEPCTLTEWQADPPKIARIRDRNLRDFASFLNERWKVLCRRVKPIKHPKRHSLISVPEQFIVPGGRFREFYYWDAYWIVKGLVVSNLNGMVKSMLTNFLHCVQEFGFVPNGGRVYYLRRSQPPFLIPMAYEYYVATKDIEFIKKNFDLLAKEFDFWEQRRSLSVTDKDNKAHKVYQYRTESNVPRPESYLADVQAAIDVSESERQKFFQDIASAAESGWDFSTRWFKDRHSIQTIETTNVVPIDLNALLCWNANILKFFASTIGRENDEKRFADVEKQIWEALNAIFYNETEKAWFDYNLRTKSHNTLFYPASAMPLFAGCYSELDQEKSVKIVDFLNRSGVFLYKSGIPASQDKGGGGQQWDFPNGWPPLQHIIIEGMRKSDNPYVQEMAYKLAHKWVLANYRVYKRTGKMWEKIDVVGKVPVPGAGGEYNVQDGFGWTNGVILDLLATYYDRMTLAENDDKSGIDCLNAAHRISSFIWSSIIFIMLAIFVSHSYITLPSC